MLHAQNLTSFYMLIDFIEGPIFVINPRHIQFLPVGVACPTPAELRVAPCAFVCPSELYVFAFPIESKAMLVLLENHAEVAIVRVYSPCSHYRRRGFLILLALFAFPLLFLPSSVSGLPMKKVPGGM